VRSITFSAWNQAGLRAAQNSFAHNLTVRYVAIPDWRRLYTIDLPDGSIRFVFQEVVSSPSAKNILLPFFVNIWLVAPSRRR
jgi:hypothetical protein